MVSQFVLKIIEHLPKKMVACIGRKMMYGYVDKYANLKIEGMENIKNVKRPVLLVCNHLSNSDGVVLSKVLRDEDLTFVAGVKLGSTALTNIGLIMSKVIPIKPNTADKEAIEKIVKTLKNGGSVLLFPEGTRSRKGSMIEAKKGMVLFIRMTKVPVIPIGICGTEALLPINTQDMGAEKFTYANVVVNFGKPIYYEELPQKIDKEDKHSYEDRITGYIMCKVAELLPKKYRGVYDK